MPTQKNFLIRVLDEEGIAVRSGTQCAMPLHKALGIKASARASKIPKNKYSNRCNSLSQTYFPRPCKTGFEPGNEDRIKISAAYDATKDHAMRVSRALFG